MPPTTATAARPVAGLVARRLTPAAVLLLLAATGGCATSAPADLAPSSSAAALLTPSPSTDPTLLPTASPTGSAVGTLAPGFPSALLVVPDGAAVLVSSAVPVAGTDLTTVSLNLRTEQDTAGLVEAVRAPLVAAGFVETPAATPEAGLAAQTTFSRGDGAELLVLGVLDRDGTRTLTVGGTVRTGT